MDRTAFYGNRPYAHLRQEFEQRLQTIRDAGEVPDPRIAHIRRLKDEIGHLKQTLSDRDHTVNELTDFKTHALSRIAAQHDEITRLRTAVTNSGNVRRLPVRAAAAIGPCN